jgi:hypothetical protein
LTAYLYAPLGCKENEPAVKRRKKRQSLLAASLTGPSGYQLTKQLMIDTLRCSKKADASEYRRVYTPLRGAARLREMAFENF